MCNGDNEAAAMEQEWALKQARKERAFQDQYEAWLIEQMDLKSYVIEPKEEDHGNRNDLT